MRIRFFTVTPSSPFAQGYHVGSWRQPVLALFVLISLSFGAACVPKTQLQPALADPDALVADGRLYDAIVLLQNHPELQDSAAKTQKIEGMLSREVKTRVATADGLAQKGRLAEAIRLYREAMKFDPRRQDLVEPVSKLNAELDSRRTNLFSVLNTQMAAKSYPDSHTTLLKLERLDPFSDDIGNKLNDVESRLSAQYAKDMEQGVDLYKKREYSKALAVFNRVLSVWPEHPQAINYRDRIRELFAESAKVKPSKVAKAGSGKTAKGGASTSSSDEPVQVSVDQIATVRMTEAAMFLNKGDPAKALERYNKVLDLQPNNPEAIKGRQTAIAKIGRSTEDLFREGVGFYRNEQLDKAIDRWNLVLLIDPTHDRAQKYLERAQRLLEKFKEVTTPGAG